MIKTVVTCVLLAAATLASTRTWLPPRDLKGKIDGYVSPIVADHDFAGVILVAQHGKPIFEKAYGMADIERGIKNSTTTEFGIGSITKQFTAAAILILQDRGKLSIDDPLSKYVPDFPKADQITLKMMLTHRSGILRDMPDGDHNIAIRRTAKEFVDLIKAQPLAFDPGTKQSYSNEAFGVLAYVIEKVSGQDYGQFLRENIFAPLQMDSTGVSDEQALDANRAIGYDPWFGPDHLGHSTPHSDSNGIGSGSLYSTVEDLYKWDQSFAGNKILSDKAKAEMLDPSDGLGLDSRKMFGRTLVSHNGVYFGYTGFVERYLEDDVSIIYLGNIESGASVDTLEGALRAIVFSQPYAPAATAPPVLAGPVDRVDDYAGVYNVFPGLDLYVQPYDGRLLLGAGQGFFPLEQMSDGKFFYRLKYATVEFVRADGQITGLRWSQDGATFDCKKVS